MKLKIAISLMLSIRCVISNYEQTALTIKKKSSMKLPGMPEISKLPAGMKNLLEGTENRKSSVHIKGSWMRTDALLDQNDSKTPIIQTDIFQYDKKRMVMFNSKKKEYYDQSTVPASTTAKNSKKGGYVTFTGKRSGAGLHKGKGRNIGAASVTN